MLGRSAGRRNWRADTSSGRRSKHGDPLHGHHFLHTALDGHSRLAYSELLSDERKETAAAFWRATHFLEPPVMGTRGWLTAALSDERKETAA